MGKRFKYILYQRYTNGEQTCKKTLNAEQNHSEISFIPVRMNITGKRIESADEDLEKLKPVYITDMNVQLCSCSGNSLAVPQMLNI